MFAAGTQLRQLRQQRRLSQARLAELAEVPQHILSAFELEKIDLCDEHHRKILVVLSDPGRHKNAIERKKRYRKHSYGSFLSNSQRVALARKSDGSAEYLRILTELSSKTVQTFTGISLFSGCGGLSLGFSSAGCDIKGFVEIDDGLARIYYTNFPQAQRIGSDITQVRSATIREFLRAAGDMDVLIGGPPCQGFSLSGKRDVHDHRNYLFHDFMRFVDVVNPKVAIIENVRLLTSMRSKRGGLVKDEIIRGFHAHGYIAKLYSVDASNYGVPQHRERVFFLAVRSDLGVTPSFPKPKYHRSTSLFHKPLRTFADACSDLQYIEAGQNTADPLHVAVRHPDHVIRWLWDVPQGASAHDNDDPDLRPPSGYNTTYKRQIWDQPGATVQTTFGMISGCRNVHPIATRSLTVREAARLQSFPDGYTFAGPIGTIRKGIGNAVPPFLARAIADHVRATILDLVEVASL